MRDNPPPHKIPQSIQVIQHKNHDRKGWGENKAVAKSDPSRIRSPSTLNVRLLHLSQIHLLLHQTLQLSRIRKLDLGKPSLLLRTLIDDLGRLFQLRVSLNDLACHGAEDVRSGLDGLDSPDGLARGDVGVDGGQFYKDDVTQRVGGVFSYANGCCFIFIFRYCISLVS